MNYEVKREGDFSYIESNSEQSENLVLLHGLFGALSNFKGIIDYFGNDYNVVIPILPIYDLPLRKAGLGGLRDHFIKFIEYKQYDKIHLLGNSLGGHISLLYVLSQPDKVASLTLTGSSGLFESAMGSTFPRRGDYEYIRNKTADTFYDPAIATKELVDEVFDSVNNRSKAISIIATAKSAIRHNIGDRLHTITAPTLLVWGAQDKVTPPFVGEKFHELIPNSRLVFIDKCGHAPMMEHPQQFNEHLKAFLQEVTDPTRLA